MDVSASKRGPVHVVVKVTPYESIDVTSEAPVLHEALVTGLTAMCGERLGAIDVEFLEPQQASSLVVPAEEDAETSDEGEAPAPAEGGDAGLTPDDTGDITIRMSGERGE